MSAKPDYMAYRSMHIDFSQEMQMTRKYNYLFYNVVYSILHKKVMGQVKLPFTCHIVLDTLVVGLVLSVCVSITQEFMD